MVQGRVLLALGSLFTIVAAACAAPAAPAPGTSAAEPYRIGINVALTGPVADSYAPVYEAVNVYFQGLNEQGGIDGHPVNIMVEDDASDASKATNNATKLVEQEKVHLLFLSSLSATYGPIMQTTKAAGTPLFIASVCPKEAFPPADPLVFCSSSFGALYDSTFAVQFVKEASTESVKFATVAMDIPISRTTMDHAASLAAEAGMQVVSKQVIPPTATDYTPFASQLQEAGANWVLAWAPWGTQIGPFDALQKLGWKGNYLLWAHQPAEEELGRRKADNLYAFGGNALFAENLPVHAEIRAGVDKYKTTYPVEHMAEGWSAAMALEQALRACGWPCGPKELQTAMSKLEVDTKGLRGGELIWTADNHYRTKAYYKVYRWDSQQNTIGTARDWVGIDVQPAR